MTKTESLDPLLLPEHRIRPVEIGRDVLPDRLRPQAAQGVLDITEWFGDTSGGIRTYLLQKAQYVEARPWLRQVITVPGAHDSITETDGVRMYRLQGPRIPRQHPYRFMLATRSVARVVRHEQPSIIEIGSPFIVPWVVRHATAALDVPLVCFYHSNLPRLFAPRAGRGGVARYAIHRASWRYMRQLDRLFRLTIVTSKFAAKDLQGEGIDRLAHVPLGVDLDTFSPTLREHRDETRHRYAIPDGLIAGFVGRFAREKELDVLLDAWSTVERRTGCRLVLVGAGPMEPVLRAHPYGSRVVFVPFQQNRDRLARLLACFDLYVAPGSIETFGLSSLEALSCGTPLLAADQGGVSEQVENSGAGAVFASGVSDSLAEEAITLLQADMNMLGQRGRAYAEREHDWAKVFDRLFDLYRSVTESGVPIR